DRAAGGVFGRVAQLGAAVAAHVGVGVQRALDRAGDDDALAGDVDDAPVARRQGADVTGVEPAGVEDAGALEGEHFVRAVVVTSKGGGQVCGHRSFHGVRAAGLPWERPVSYID